MKPVLLAIASVGLLASLTACWDAELTDELLGEQNAAAAAAAAAAGEDNWTEMGVGVTENGQPYLHQITRGRPYKHIRAGLLLVATAQIQGEIFEQSVVLLVRHDANGTLGLVLNKRAQLSDEDLSVAEALEDTFGVLPRNPHALEELYAGGPVGATSQTMWLHGGPPPETKKRCYQDGGGGFGLVGSDGQPLRDESEGEPAGEEVLRGVHFQGSGAYRKCALRDPNGPPFRVFFGFSGWGAQQLDGEWRRGAWMLCDSSREAVFGYGSGPKLWEELSSGLLGANLCSRVPQSEDRWTERESVADS